MRLLLIGTGKMGMLVDRLAPEYGATVVGRATSSTVTELLGKTDSGADVAIDFTRPEAVPLNFPRLAEHGLNIVIGTTGWSAHEPELRSVAAAHGIGVLAAPNFSIGMSVFQMVVDEAARRFEAQPAFDAWIHEWHHAAKRDAPSGTALQLQAGMTAAGYDRGIAISSTRAGHVPGTHEVGFDSVAETITLTHVVRDRSVFARGALQAANWLMGKRGWFTMRDMVGPHFVR